MKKESILDYGKQIGNAKTAQDVLSEFKRENPDMYARFIKWFHLRPTSDRVTIVTTHPDRPMRGIRIGKTKIKNAVEFLSGCIDGKTIDWPKIAGRYNAGKGFEPGTGNGRKEYPYQAQMINNLHNNKALKDLLGVRELKFIASEVIFSRNKEIRKRIDIVAHDGAGKVFFFEMKAPENKPDESVEQVKEYLKTYGKDGEKNKTFEEMMANYPQNPIAEITEYIGYVVVGYGEDPVLNKEKGLIEFKN